MDPHDVSISFIDFKAEKWVRTLRQSAKSDSGDMANRVGAIAFSPDGKWLIGGDVTGYTLWQVATGKQKFKWRSGMGEPLSPAWSPDGKSIALPAMVQPGAPAYESFPNGVALVDTGTGKSKMFFAVEIGYPRTARFSPDGKLLATAGHDCTVRVFDTAAKTNVFNDFTEGTMFAVGFSPDGRYLVAGSSWGGVLLIYEVRSEGGKTVIEKQGKSRPGAGEVHSVEFAPDGKLAVSNVFGGMVLWNASTWRTFKTITGALGGLSADGKQIAIVRESAPSVIELWAVDQLEKTMSAQN